MCFNSSRLSLFSLIFNGFQQIYKDLDEISAKVYEFTHVASQISILFRFSSYFQETELFMYLILLILLYICRGDTAFCSVECREQQMKNDEIKEKCSSLAMASKKEDRHASTSSSSKAAASRKSETMAVA